MNDLLAELTRIEASERLAKFRERVSAALDGTFWSPHSAQRNIDEVVQIAAECFDDARLTATSERVAELEQRSRNQSETYDRLCEASNIQVHTINDLRERLARLGLWRVVDPNNRLVNRDGERVGELLCSTAKEAEHWHLFAQGGVAAGERQPFIVPPVSEREARLEAACQLEAEFQEINLANYGDDDVRRLQDWAFRFVDAARAALATPANP